MVSGLVLGVGVMVMTTDVLGGGQVPGGGRCRILGDVGRKWRGSMVGTSTYTFVDIQVKSQERKNAALAVTIVSVRRVARN